MSRLPVQLILLGPPGAGKGTQAARLARRLGLAHINPGRILREAAAGESPVSREIRDRMAAGELVDDQLVDRLVRERLEALSPGQGFILDGYPRTAGEARSLQGTLARLHRLRRPPLVVWLQASPDVLVRRLRDRARDEHRVDDSERAIGHRLQVDRDNAPALRDALAGWTDVIEIDADHPPDAITEEIIHALRRHAAAWTSPRVSTFFRSDT
ncbi:MAG: adenylate kinase family protein [Solirubrobacteraceae bacterium]